MTSYTIVHALIGLIGIASGFVVVGGVLALKRLDRWTAVFLATTVATSATGFGFPFEHLLPSHIVGVISLLVLGVAIFARYPRQLAGRWRPTYVVSAVLALYLNVFVGIVQAFLKIPVLHRMAPTQSEPPFVATELITLGLFVVVAIAGVVRSRVDRH
jgi:hypothetical protein